MILAYHRPDTLEQALDLLGRPAPLTLPLGGGRLLSRPVKLRATPLAALGESFEVVDLQALGLDRIEPAPRSLVVGAAVRLSDLAEALDGAAPPSAAYELARLVRHEFNPHQAALATIAGALVGAAGTSLVAAALLALDSEWELAGGEQGRQEISSGDLLAMRSDRLKGRLLTRLTLPLAPSLAFEWVSRTPADRPLVFAGVARWSSGRTRVVVGGWGAAPTLALDGPEPGGALAAAQQAASHAVDEWASAEYRREMVALFVERCLARLQATPAASTPDPA
jgi:CO/xanthine dehydrogenase FAD-binding subunit